MKVDLDKPLLDLDGERIAVTERKVIGNVVAEVPVRKKVKAADGTETEADQFWTLGRLCVNALSTPHKADEGMEAAKVIERWRFALDLNRGGEQDLKAEQMTELSKRLALFTTQYGMLMVGQACDMLKG